MVGRFWPQCIPTKLLVRCLKGLRQGTGKGQPHRVADGGDGGDGGGAGHGSERRRSTTQHKGKRGWYRCMLSSAYHQSCRGPDAHLECLDGLTGVWCGPWRWLTAEDPSGHGSAASSIAELAFTRRTMLWVSRASHVVGRLW